MLSLPLKESLFLLALTSINTGQSPIYELYSSQQQVVGKGKLS